jgi:hypothetical protein
MIQHFIETIRSNASRICIETCLVLGIAGIGALVVWYVVANCFPK